MLVRVAALPNMAFFTRGAGSKANEISHPYVPTITEKFPYYPSSLLLPFCHSVIADLFLVDSNCTDISVVTIH